MRTDKLFIGLFIAMAGAGALFFAGCDGDNSGVSQREFAPPGIAGLTIELKENGGVTNVWTFPPGANTSGSATMNGAASFPFTYAKTGPATSRLTFDVGGTDKYEMKWTSASGGTFKESFNGAAGNDGTFTVKQQGSDGDADETAESEQTVEEEAASEEEAPVETEQTIEEETALEEETPVETEQTAEEETAQTDFAPAGIGGKSIQFNEQGGPSNVWIFPAGSETSGKATLTGSGDFDFTYTKTGVSTSTITFDVGGTDKYEMIWTSASGGTFKESFNNVAGTEGTFTAQ